MLSLFFFQNQFLLVAHLPFLNFTYFVDTQPPSGTLLFSVSVLTVEICFAGIAVTFLAIDNWISNIYNIFITFVRFKED